MAAKNDQYGSAHHCSAATTIGLGFAGWRSQTVQYRSCNKDDHPDYT